MAQLQTGLPLNDARDPSLGWHGLRWKICALVFLACTINYIDRQIIGVLKPTLMDELGWNEIDYSNIVFWFQLAYAGGYLFGGRLMDLIGVRVGYALSVALWSVAAVLHAAVRSVTGFSAARFGLGLAEGGNFPAAVKTVSDWFPRKERAFATGLFNSGTNIGAIVTPLTVPWIALKWGWQAAFIITGALGFIWLILWLMIYHQPENHPRLSKVEMDYIRSDPPDPPTHVPWLTLLAYRPTWAFIVGFLFSGPIWWFYLFWVPGYLYKQHGLTQVTLGLPLAVIYLVSDGGSIAGGWLSSWLIKRGWSVNAARKTAMLTCALCVVPVFLASTTSSLWVATIVISLAAAAHQGWAANLYTLVSDTMPRRAVSSVIGIGGFAGAIGGMFNALLVGYAVQTTGNYVIPFTVASGAYVVALAIMHLLVPRIEPVGFVGRGFPVIFREPK